MSEQATLDPSAPSATPVRPPTPVDRSASSLSGRQKAAVLLISLGAERAANVLKHLGEREVESLSAEMAALWRVRPETSAAVMREVEDRLSSNDAVGGGIGGPEFAREVLEQLVGTERADEIIGTVTAKPETRPFEFLRRTPPEQIHAFLKDESPQTIALVVASVHSTLAARVLAELQPELQADVALRIATMSETNPDVIRDIEQGLRLKLANVVGQEFAAAGGVDALAEILNRAGRSTERNVVGADQRVRPGPGRRDPAAPVHLRGPRHPGGPRPAARAARGRPEGAPARPARRRPARRREDPGQHVPARRRDAARGHGDVGPAAARRSSRRPRARSSPPCGASRTPARSSSAAAPKRKRRSCERLRPLRARSRWRPSSSPSRPARRRGARRSTPIREQAYEEGFAAGIAAGAEPRSTAPRPPSPRAAEQLQALRADAAASVEADAVDLALRIAEQAVGAAIAADPELVVEAVRGALRRLVERDRVLILVNPDDLELVRDARRAARGRAGRHRALRGAGRAPRAPAAAPSCARARARSTRRSRPSSPAPARCSSTSSPMAESLAEAPGRRRRAAPICIAATAASATSSG